MHEKIKAIKDRAIIEADKIVPGNDEVLWDLFVDMFIKECVSVVKQTGKQCAFTTYDLGMVECAINMCAKTLEDHFKE